MKLRDLDADFIGEVKPDRSYRRLPSMDGAQGVIFQCPKCAQGKPTGEENGRKYVEGAHYIICWFNNPINAPKVPDNMDPKPGRWNAQGTSLDDLTFVGPGAYSVQLYSGCEWHGFVSNGDAS